jgi:intracellular septation protein A
MKNIIIIAVLAGALLILNYINPTLEDHKSSISSEINLDNPVWDNLEYKSFFVASSTSNKKNSSMVSLGFCKYIKVVNTEWIDQQNK